ncbi:hypothetical protein GobsT_01810 [Gemmata obscuriglobus]|nr:hypothetical protein GobsT_01810 [Gemmata obscuriglobus]VTR98630.1 Uncharacterized protein OS=Cystobacter violaceus Cb vi76 GN=Q664_12435 PE=4 SV=1: DUF3592 [Gemmata obscuriglobus UQM 2246]
MRLGVLCCRNCHPVRMCNPMPTELEDKQQKQRERRQALAVIALGLLALDGWVAFAWVHQIRSASFPTTPGVVVGHHRVPSGKSTRPVIVYEYEVDGIQRTSDCCWYDAAFIMPPLERELTARFPIGAQVSVSYNPADPADAVLLPGLQGAHVFGLLWLIALNLCPWGITQAMRESPPDDYVKHTIRFTKFGWRIVLTAGKFPVPSSWLFVFALFFGGPLLAVVSGPFPTTSEAVQVLLVSSLMFVFAAFGCAWVQRWRARLDVDVEKRELRWRSGRLLDGTFRLPFEAVVDVRTAEHEDHRGIRTRRLEIDWYTTKDRTQTLVIPGGANWAAVEAVAARLRETVFGASTLD